jgi:hypothetical protein
VNGVEGGESGFLKILMLHFYQQRPLVYNTGCAACSGMPVKLGASWVLLWVMFVVDL